MNDNSFYHHFVVVDDDESELELCMVSRGVRTNFQRTYKDMTVICEGGYIALSYLLMIRQFTYQSLWWIWKQRNDKNNNNNRSAWLANHRTLEVIIRIHINKSLETSAIYGFCPVRLFFYYFQSVDYRLNRFEFYR